MTSKIDKAGGVILRKRKWAQPRRSLTKKAPGLWVYTGKVPPGFDPARAMEADREERPRKLAGW